MALGIAARVDGEGDDLGARGAVGRQGRRHRADEQARKWRQRQIDVALLPIAQLVDGEAGRATAGRHHQRHREVAVGADGRRWKLVPVDGDGHGRARLALALAR